MAEQNAPHAINVALVTDRATCTDCNSRSVIGWDIKLTCVNTLRGLDFKCIEDTWLTSSSLVLQKANIAISLIGLFFFFLTWLHLIGHIFFFRQKKKKKEKHDQIHKSMTASSFYLVFVIFKCKVNFYRDVRYWHFYFLQISKNLTMSNSKILTQILTNMPSWTKHNMANLYCVVPLDVWIINNITTSNHWNNSSS